MPLSSDLHFSSFRLTAALRSNLLLHSTGHVRTPLVSVFVVVSPFPSSSASQRRHAVTRQPISRRLTFSRHLQVCRSSLPQQHVAFPPPYATRCSPEVVMRPPSVVVTYFSKPNSLFTEPCKSFPSVLSPGVSEITLEFWGFMTSAVGANSPLLGFIYGVAYLTGTVSFGIPRLICASFGITRLICASFGITRLICKGNARDRPARGKKDVKMPPRGGARRGGQGGRGRGAGRVQPEVQPVAQATNPAAPVTHVDLAAIEQRFTNLIMLMQEQQ
ncbi:gag protease polyprotein [Cucumis melo var. makuwa]|uniref:Gag protease polyprotein n=1 Tax=Cucumis melo var. makuwa TaxID=1194695 RepID=A0A5A7SN53_CUCMM|nr:gag protease polyprotein [Cucumis melo var. makuwa]